MNIHFKQEIYKQTYSGIAWDIMHPKAENVLACDIVAPLERTWRFGASMVECWTVADHSVLVAELVGHVAKPYALLHDAHEAYLGDITTPVAKAIASPHLESLKMMHDKVIFEAFGLAWPTEYILAEIKLADAVALVLEKEQFLVESDAWNLTTLPPVNKAARSIFGHLRTQHVRFEDELRNIMPKLPDA